MIIAAIAALGLFHHGPGPTIELYQQNFKDWSVQIRRDTFAGRSTCTLFAGRYEGYAPAAFEAGSVVFRFRASTETRDAWYRVDGGPARRASAEVLARPVRYNTAATLDSSTGGYVFIPAAALMRARIVEIRPNETGRVRRYAVAGLSDALDAVRARGCAVQAVE